jgi:two-component system, chemotaxis family, response regulator Rcp1
MSNRTIPHSTDVLLIEGNPVDILITTMAFDEGGFDFRLRVAEDGEQALDFLHQNCDSIDAGASCPDLILLDLNLPKKSGNEVLGEIRENPSTSPIPVIILAASAEEKDVTERYSQCYVTKPVGVGNFQKAIQCTGEFRIEIPALPRNSN